jgi:hypothetical protein
LGERVAMGLGLLMPQREPPRSSRVSPREGLGPASGGGPRAELAPGRQVLGVKVAAAPREGRPAPMLVGRPLGKLTEPPAGAPRAAAAVAEESVGGWPQGVCRRNRRTCCRPETSYDISGIQVVRTVEHSAERRVESPQPGGASRIGRRLSRSRGSHSRSSRMEYSVQFLHSLLR